jgi:hypothetical protein
MPLYIDRKDKLALLNHYRKLPTQDQLIIKAVTNAEKQGTPNNPSHNSGIPKTNPNTHT